MNRGIRASLALGVTLLAGCGARTGLRDPDAATEATADAGRDAAVTCATSTTRIDTVDVLFEIDNSNSMRDNQTALAAQFRTLIDALVSPPIDPATSLPRYPAVRSLHVGVISSDLGTPGSMVPSCTNSDVGDDGLLNPIRRGQAIRAHLPWTTAPAGVRPARCTMDPNQYPTFLTFDASATDAAGFRDDFVCNAFLSVGGCGLEQQLESAYRALVIHDARERPGNTSPNAGFVRDAAVLAIVLVTDEEDGSVRDCRYAERGVPCTSAITVYDNTSAEWSSIDLNLRLYMYTPGSALDPTWNVSRYVDPANPARGFPGLKPGHPERVVFAAITGVPIELPRTGPLPHQINWDALLGRAADGSQGYTAMSPEGPVSMRQRAMDPECATRVVPACRREGTTYRRGVCDTNSQYFAWPSRRIALVARRFAETWGTGTVSSICRTDYGLALRDVVDRIGVSLCR